jgi:hypothetical protein
VGVVDWIHLDQDRGQWLVFVNTVMKLRVLELLSLYSWKY